MSASQRTLARLPLQVFEQLINDPVESLKRPEMVREAIIAKLKSFPRKTRNGVVVQSVKSVGDFLRLSIPALLRALDPLLTYAECKELVRRTCLACSPEPCTALSLLQDHLPTQTTENRTIPTALSKLDHHLRGGIRIGSVTEFVGCAGVGKTQLAMQLCVLAASQGQGSVFIDTEKKLSLNRLREIASKRSASPGLAKLNAPGGFSYDEPSQDENVPVHGECGDNSRVQGDKRHRFRSCEQVLTNVTLHSPATTEELLSIVNSIEEEILMRNEEASTRSDDRYPVRLLVLDSIAAPVRRDFGSGSAPQRAAAVIQCAQVLKRLAHELNLAVVVINQIGAGNEGMSAQAALGTAWHHCVSTRIMLSTTNESTGTGVPGVNGDDTQSCARHASVVKSNIVGRGQPTEYVISAWGVTESQGKA